MGNTHDGHTMVGILPTNAMMLPHGMFGFKNQRVHGDVQVTVVQPVVLHLQFHLLIVRLTAIAHQLDIFPRLAYATGKLLWRIGGTEHEHPFRSRGIYLPHGVVAHDTIFSYQSEQGGTLTALALGGVGLLLQHLLYIIR